MQEGCKMENVKKEFDDFEHDVTLEEDEMITVQEDYYSKGKTKITKSEWMDY